MLLHWSDPLITFDGFRDPPSVFIFQANLSGPPSESFQSFQWSPLWGSQLRLIPPQKILRPPLPPPQIVFITIIIIIIVWRVTLFSCHAGVLGDAYSQLRHSAETGLSPAAWASLNLRLVIFFDHRLRIVIIIIIGPFRFLSLLRMCNEIHENRHGSWQKHSPPCILIPTLYRANQKLRLGNQSWFLSFKATQYLFYVFSINWQKYCFTIFL